MLVADFPRPKNDNRRGVHWSASVYHPVGNQLDRWIDELQALNIKWVKVLDDSGGSSLDLCKRLVAVDIFPIVRLYRHAPNPGHISSREADTVRAMVAAGVHYFESNNEPDLRLEWKGSKIPENWLDVVLDGFIFDADNIIGLGGLPALPAMGVGSKDAPVDRVVAKGRADLFEKGAWLAIHNYTLNHPLDYPYDSVNQQGTPLSQDEYDRLGPWAWDNQPPNLINQWRSSDKNPGKTLVDDPVCFLAWKLADELATGALGHKIPIISTEGGPVMGWRDDRRYPRLSAQLHADWVVAIDDFLQGNRQIHGLSCPDNYFTMCHWLLGNQHLGFFNITWESQSWFTDWWNTVFDTQGHLPVVDAVRAMPNLPVDKVDQGLIYGTLVRADNGAPLASLLLELQAAGRVVATITTGVDGSFRFERLAPGSYDLATGGQVIHSAIPAGSAPGQALTVRMAGGNQSVLSGTVADSAGALTSDVPVTLARHGTVIEQASTGSDGSFRFAGLPLGTYQVSVPGITVAGLALDGWLAKTLRLSTGSATGFRYVVTRRRLVPPGEPAESNAFYGTVVDAAGKALNGAKVQMAWPGAAPGTSFPLTTSGKDPYKPAGYYQFTHSKGVFQLKVIQGDWPSDVATGLDTAQVPGRQGQEITYEVNFQLQPEGGAAHVQGQVPGGTPGTRITLTDLAAQPAGSSATQETSLAADGAFSFLNLPLSTYQLSLQGIGVMAPAIQLAQGGLYNLVFSMRSQLLGQVLHGAAGLIVELVPPAPWDWRRQIAPDAAGNFSFQGLPAGQYRLRVADKTLSDLQLNGENVLHVGTIEITPSPPSQGVLKGLVRAAGGALQPSLVIRLLQDGVDVSSTQTDAAGAYRFSDLAPGVYALAVGSGATLVTGIALAAGATMIQDLQLSPGADNLVAHYLLFGKPQGSAHDTSLALDLVLPLLTQGGVTGGFSLDEAAHAARVTIVGDDVPALAEGVLMSAGCQVTRLSGDAYALAKRLDQLMANPA